VRDALEQPRSGVAGLKPHQLRAWLLALGWPGLPIAAHDAGGNGAGKRPAIRDWPRFAEYGAALPTLADLAEWERLRDAPGTGFAMGDLVAIDLDFLDPAKVDLARGITLRICGATPFIRQGRAPKLAMVYRAAEPIDPVRLPGVDIQGQGTELVAYGIHPGTGAPYEWLEASPLEVGPEAAPEVTKAQIEKLCAALEPLTAPAAGKAARKGKGGRKGGGGGLGAIILNADGLVVDGREAFLTSLSWRLALELEAAGRPIEADDLAGRIWSTFVAEVATLERGEGRPPWSIAAARAKAEAIARKAAAGPLRSAKPPGPAKVVPPAYPDDARPVDEARPAIRNAVLSVLKAGKEWNAADQATRGAPPVYAIRVATGVGKMQIMAELLAAEARANPDASFAIVVPTHRLGDAIVAELARLGVTARVFRGRKAPDPERDGKTMCDDLGAVEIALDLGATVSKACCEGKNPEGEKVRCNSYSQCGYQRQKKEKPQVWIIGHEMLHRDLAYLGKISFVFIDESFWQSGIRKARCGLTFDEIAMIDPKTIPTTDGARDAAAFLRNPRAAVARALRRQEDVGGVKRQHLVDEGLTAALCAAAIKDEWKLKREAAIWPGMPSEARRKAAAAARGAKQISEITRVWRGAADLLGPDVDPDAASGRIVIATAKAEGESQGRVHVVQTRGVRPFAEQWDVPTFIMDATLPAPEILRAFYPQVEVKAEIDVAAPHAMIRQVINPPVSKSKLLNGGEAKRNIKNIRRYILRE
jgi:hypothetical protein